MNIDVIYKGGAFIPIHPVSVKCDRLTIAVPDDAIQQKSDESEALATSVNASGQSLRKELDRILGKFACSGTASIPGEDKRVWHNHLMEKHCR